MSAWGMRTVLIATGLVVCLTVPALAQPAGEMILSTPSTTSSGEILSPAKPSAADQGPAPDAAETPVAPIPDFGGGGKTSPDQLNLETRDRGVPSGVDPKDIPDIIWAEVNEIEKYCNANIFYSSYHDCRCIAVKFLDARLKSEPTVARDVIFQQVSSECPNEPGIAGFVYKSCVDVFKYTRPTDVEKLCTCTANNVATNYTTRPSMNMRYIDRLRKRALIACGVGQDPAYTTPAYTTK